MQNGLVNDWYKEAVFYEIRLRSFCDSDGDGIGDFVGLTGRLDYLEALGVTALWVLPFYPSPLRDDGYDIADYTSVHPDCGSLANFDDFVQAAHARGMRIVTEFVLNHTSDQHPWFQRARRAAKGSSERAWYLWSDSDDRLPDVRIIFKDFERSNWAWDPIAGQYYFHRFFSSQPDLNFDHPEVREAILEVANFWFERGVDGLRLDAVPYLFKREGTTSESLPETHSFLKELRARVDARYPGRMLLAEANQWPQDTVAYFGQGDECHMAFNFPVMPRLYLALAVEDATELARILDDTPEIPKGAQWANFLRNHDELSLEMVSDQERELLWRVLAPDPQTRINLGIRRRLAPLLGGDRRQIELLCTLLLTLQGSPVLYYGDEIGMGDNVQLPDRHGVRTPMQWNSDRNSGFSTCDPQQLAIPVVRSLEDPYIGVNVEAQQHRSGSLLGWMRGALAARRRHGALFGRGSFRRLQTGAPAVLAFVREHEGERALVAANFASSPQLTALPAPSGNWRDWRTDVVLGNLGTADHSVLLGPHEALVLIQAIDG